MDDQSRQELQALLQQLADARLRSLATAFTATARTIGAAAPAVLSIADRIVDVISKIHGLG